MESKNTLPISFEFFPPKTDKGHEKLLENASRLAEVGPGYFSVTYGAGGSTQETTLKTVLAVQNSTEVSTAPHISCIHSTREKINDLLQQYRQSNINRLVVLRGDKPSGTLHATGDFNYANELVEHIRSTTGDHFHIEVAAYPEFHPETTDARQGLLNFKRKIDAGANGAITQYFYNADAYFYFRDACDALGARVPIVAGIMPITNYQQLARFSDMCGAEIPRWLRRRLESCGDDKVEICKVGEEVVTRLCERLIAGGVPGLHFYTLNKAEPSLAVLENLRITQQAVVTV